MWATCRWVSVNGLPLRLKLAVYDKRFEGEIIFDDGDRMLLMGDTREVEHSRLREEVEAAISTLKAVSAEHRTKDEEHRAFLGKKAAERRKRNPDRL